LNNQHTLTIQSLVYEGFGLSRLPDGKAVFVPYVLPGEQVTVRIQEEKQHHALAELIRVDEPGKDRIVPRCAHFGTCGGCHYQHIPYKQQLAYKKEIFKEQLQRIAHFDAPVIENLIPSSIEWHYRNALQFQVSPQGNLCFADEQTNALFAVRECHLPMTAIDEFWRQLEFEPGSYRGRLEIRQNHQD
jgi:23S rRNA (uracil1939-C5)-methyltransferase